jgi:uncharacterized hydrophobic protein (TIGR00271 family)
MRQTLKSCVLFAGSIPEGFEGCILLSVAHPGRAAGLAVFAAELAAAERRPVLVLNVQRPGGEEAAPAVEDDLSRWPAVERALEALAKAGTPSGWLVCQSNDIGRAIRRMAAQAHAATIVLGWRGRLGADGAVTNAMLKDVLQDPLADVVVVGGRSPAHFDRILAPYAGGAHSELAIKLALKIARHRRMQNQEEASELTALHVKSDDQSNGAFKESMRTLRHALESSGDAANLLRAVEVTHGSPAKAILEELERQDYDLVLMGTSREEVFDQVLFGVVPQQVAEESDAPVIVVRRHTPLAPRMLRRAWHLAADALPTLNTKEQAEVSAAIRKGATAQADFYVMIGLSTIIAALGLLLNSPAVIIGAMLVAPLMAAIIGMALGIVHGDQALLLKSARTSAAGIAIAIAIGLVIGWLVPNASATPEVMARTAPNLLDLFVALAAGAAGAYALCRKEVAASLAGVAIAVALVPPLATVGITLSLLRFDLAGGAGLLFSTNLVAIAASGAVVFLLLGFAPPETHKKRRLTFWRSLWGVAGLLLAIALILGALTLQSLRQVRIDAALRTAIENQLDTRLEADVLEATYTTDASGALRIEATVRSVRLIPNADIAAVQQDLANQLDRPVALAVAVLPSVELPAVEPASGAAP